MRQATVKRATKETDIVVELDLDVSTRRSIDTGLPFLDHMLDAFSLHAGVGLLLDCQGDLQVDDHHTVEDCALALGEAFNRALADRAGITRFGAAYAPLDEALARTVIDFSGRPASAIDLQLQREMLGAVACENIRHFFSSFATAARCSLHVDVLKGDNDHHRAEAAFKSFALAVKQAITLTGADVAPSTKGALL